VFFPQKGNIQPHDYFGGEDKERGCKRNIFRGKGVDTTKVRDTIFIVPIEKIMGQMKRMISKSLARR
jgi:hypothetical protein